MSEQETVPEFHDEQAALNYLESQFDSSDNPDNYRFAYLDDAVGMKEYDRLESKGCCGCAELDVIVAGRAARVGCNYGH